MRLSQLLEKEIAVHKSNDDFGDIDLSKSSDGTFWLAHPSAEWDSIIATGNTVEHYFEIIPTAKLATWDDIDRYSIDQLENMGFDGVKMDDGGTDITYQIWNTNVLKRVDRNKI